MNDLYVILGAVAVLVLVIIINQININVKVKKTKKLNLKCPECGESLEHEVFDIELDSKDATIGAIHFDHGVKYYHVMTCPKCYYTVKLDDVETMNKLKEKNKG